MIKKVSSIILIIIGLVFITCGCFLMFYHKDEKIKPKEDKSSVDTMSQAEIDKLYNRERNQSSLIPKKHCFDDVCIENMQITYEDGMLGVISGDISNVSNKNISEGALKLSFQNGESVFSEIFLYPDLKVGEEFALEIQYTNYDILSSSDYSIVLPTDEEIALYLGLET